MRVLTKAERRVLTILEEDGRLPATRIAKKARLSTEGVIKLIRRLEDRGIINRHNTKVNYSRMGYMMYPVHVKLQRRDAQAIADIRRTIARHATCAWHTFAEGEYDLLLSFKVTSHEDMRDMESMLRSLSELIREKHVGVVLHAFEISKSFLSTHHPQKLFATYSHDLGSIALSETQMRILTRLRSDSRISMLDLAREVGLSARAVSTKIRELERLQVISGFKIKLNSAMLGYQPCIALMQMGRYTKKELQRFMTYCRHKKGIHYLVQQIGAYDMELTIDAQGVNDFYSLMDEIRDEFPFINKVTTLIAKELS